MELVRLNQQPGKQPGDQWAHLAEDMSSTIEFLRHTYEPIIEEPRIMPIFEYRCPACEHAFEELVRNGERVPCPKCGHKDPEKLISATAAHVQTSGGLPIQSSCPPADAPPCSPHCCRLP